MLEEPKIKKVDKRDKQLPQNFEQLIEMYDVEKIWPYVLKIVQVINKDIPEDLRKITEDHEEDIEKLVEEYGLEEILKFFNSASKLMNFNDSGVEVSEPITAPKFNGKLNGTFIGGTNYIPNSQSPVKMVRPSSNYNRYHWDIEHPMALKRATVDHTYTLSFKFIPEADGYVPMTAIVVGGIDGVDAWQIRLLLSYFEVEEYEDYQIWSHSFNIPGNGSCYLQDHIGFLLDSADGNTNIGGTVYEIKLEDGANRTSWTPNINDHEYMYGSDEIPFEYNADKYDGSLRYIVKNGVCYLHVFFKTLIPQSGWTYLFKRSDVVPRPIVPEMCDFVASTQINKASTRFNIQSDGNISIHGGEAGTTDYTGQFAYPCI